MCLLHGQSSPPAHPATVSHTNYVRYLLSLLMHLPPTQPPLFPLEESLKEQQRRHLLSSLPLPQCSSVCSNHINIPQSCFHQGDPTPSGWLLSSPDRPTSNSPHSCSLLLLLRDASRMALSPPSSHFLPGSSSPPVISAMLQA